MSVLDDVAEWRPTTPTTTMWVLDERRLKFVAVPRRFEFPDVCIVYSILSYSQVSTDFFCLVSAFVGFLRASFSTFVSYIFILFPALEFFHRCSFVFSGFVHRFSLVS